MDMLSFTQTDWERIRHDHEAWWAHELDHPLVHLAVQAPVDGPRPYSYQSNFPADMPVEQVVDLYEPYLRATRYYADAFPWLWVNYGPGIGAGFLGADVNSVTDPSETVWFNPKQRQPIDRLELCYDPGNPWFQRVKDFTQEMVRRYDGMVQVSHTDLGGNLDILASFTTTSQLLFDVIEQPEQVERLARQITAAWLRYYADLDAIIRPACPGTSSWTPIWSPGKTYMLQSDFAYMIGPKMFERFVLPDLAACCEYLDHGFYHLDGKGQIPHLDLLLGIERLRGIQWIPGDGQPSPDQWLPLLKRIRDGGKLCQVFVSPQGARCIVQHLGGKGFLFVLHPRYPEFQNPEEAEAFLRVLREEDISLAK